MQAEQRQSRKYAPLRTPTAKSLASFREAAAIRPNGTIALMWQQFGAYHVDRGVALADALAGSTIVLGIELASRSDVYAWERPAISTQFEIVTLFEDRPAEALRFREELFGVLRVLRARRVRHLFISGYERPASFFLALICRLIGIRVYAFLDSKFDDKPRRIGLELFKSLLLAPYRAGFAAGPKAAAYLYFLGFRRRLIVQGYDTVSLARMRALAPKVESAWADRHFLIVARLVAKKNVQFALDALARYRALGGRRRLVLYGSGPLEEDLRCAAQALGIADQIEFRGFGTQPQVAAAMSTALCLLLPSEQEQWGLVVNEALAFHLPVIVSYAVGSAELLVESLVSGYVLSTDDPESWAQAMLALSSDESLWRRLSDGARRLSPRADVAAFAEAAIALATAG